MTPSPAAPPLASSRGVLAAVAAVVVFGVVLRLLGFFDLELWLDEAMWCKRLVDGQYGWIRPIGYMWLTRQLVLLHDTEPVLRSLSYVAGIAQLPLVFVLLRRLVAVSAVAVAGTFLLAIHPVAVAMTKEFKPYAVESALHTLLLLLALMTLATRRRRWLVATLAVAVVGPLFAWTLVFAYPGVFAVVGLFALLQQKRDVGVVVFGTVATFAVLIGLFLGRVAKEKRDTEFWGEKYDVFYIGDGDVFGRLAWLGKKTFEVATFPAHLHWPWPGGGVFAVVVAVVVAVGVVALLVRRQWVFLALLVTPWLVTIAFNVLGQWPYGLFRTNTFLLFYTVTLAAVGVDALLAPLWRARPAVAVAVVAAIIVVVFPHDLRAFGEKREGTLTAEASVRAALDHIRDVESREGKKPEKPLLVMDGHACGIASYYRDYNADSRARLRAFFKNDVEKRCSRVKQELWLQTLQQVKGRSFWLIAGKRGFAELTRAELAPWCTVLHDEVLPETTFLYRCQAKQPPPPTTTPTTATTPTADDVDEADED